ncbi:MAG: hypothetical protein KGQ36_03025 [Rickettsiales bacterium]|nr:hypothetical protein [Rickettsiales bacterium]
MKLEFYITDNRSFRDVIDLIYKSGIVAIDTEFSREKTYYPILSLIQIAVKDGDKQKQFIVDCLTDIDLTPFFQIISDKNITKILHSSLQDLQIFYHKSNSKSLAVSDTQIMANFCGFGFNMGYSGLVENFFSRTIDKSQQRSDWQRRPLSKRQLEYAALDVFYLEEIHNKLMKMLEENGRKDWYLEEMEIFSKNISTQFNENIFKNFTFRKKSKDQIAKIKKLALLRENWAKKLDIPRQHLLRDHAIERIVESENFSLDLDPLMIYEMKEIISRNFEFEIDADIVDNDAFMTQKQKEIYKKAKIFIADVAKKENVKEQILITRFVLKSLIYKHKTVDDLLCKWRYQLLGEKLKEIINEKTYCCELEDESCF